MYLLKATTCYHKPDLAEKEKKTDHFDGKEMSFKITIVEIKESYRLHFCVTADVYLVLDP